MVAGSRHAGITGEPGGENREAFGGGRTKGSRRIPEISGWPTLRRPSVLAADTRNEPENSLTCNRTRFNGFIMGAFGFIRKLLIPFLKYSLLTITNFSNLPRSLKMCV